MKVEIYSDVACPWCYIGAARFERALAAFPAAGDVEVSFRPFQLDPSLPGTHQNGGTSGTISGMIGGPDITGSSM
jgi:predicted DsbA family dithiol-disulfide isomerase